MPPEEMPNPVPSSVTVQPASVEAPVPPIVTAPQPPAVELPEELPPGRVLQIPSASMSQIRKAEREKGKRAHQKQLDEQARALGFKSHEDLIASAQRKSGKPAGRVVVPGKRDRAPEKPTRSAEEQTAQPEPKPAPTGAEARVLRSAERREAALRAAERQLAQERKRRKRAEIDARAARAEAVFRQEAVAAGVIDVDYALHVLHQRVSMMDKAQLAKFSEKKFFAETLRSTHPHLYGAPRTPATTGPSGSAPSTSPVNTPPGGPSAQPNPPGQPSAKPGLKDARSLTTEQMNNRLRELGLTPPGGSMPI